MQCGCVSLEGERGGTKASRSSPNASKHTHNEPPVSHGHMGVATRSTAKARTATPKLFRWEFGCLWLTSPSSGSSHVSMTAVQLHFYFQGLFIYSPDSSWYILAEF